MSKYDFDTFRDDLKRLREGTLSADKIREKYGSEEDVERSIAAAQARKTQQLTSEELNALMAVDSPD
ncbi:hypothetical protein [Halosimplex halobium]|uniref:hypothetical protein n=1 Tax=Halosimplex halobium TaxID=3396618 RepID=UPI003F558D84